MGCCGITVFQRVPEIDNANNRAELMNGLKKLISNFDQEAKEIQAKLTKGTPLKNQSLTQMDDATLKKRVPYLGELCDSFTVCIQTINKCDDRLPLKESKDLLQQLYANYLHAYDDSKRYKDDQGKFTQFATQYFKK